MGLGLGQLGQLGQFGHFVKILLIPGWFAGP